MTDDQLDAVEAALGARLPLAYRDVSRAFPFRPVGRDWVYWFYDDPLAVVRATRFPHEDGGYAGPPLPPRYVAVGESGAGDLYLLDLTGDGLPVVILSHETHEMEPGWATFEGFVAEWLAAPAECDRVRAAERAVRAAWWRRAWAIAGVIALFAFLLPLLVIVLACWRQARERGG